MTDVIALVVAAGSGRRLRAPRPKAWVPLRGRPLLVWTLEALARWDGWTHWVVVYPPEAETRDREAVETVLAGRIPIRWVVGGPRRQDSVWNGLQGVSAPDDSVVMVHDAARPLVPPGLIRRLWETVRVSGAVVPVVPVAETVKVVEDRRVRRTLDRHALFLSQTPQAFRLGILRDAYRFVQAQGISVTDEAAAVEAIGHPVTTVEGFRWNVKVTYPEDLLVVERLLDALADAPGGAE